MNPKIIHILGHSPRQTAYEADPNNPEPTLGSSNSDDYKYYIKIDKFPYWVGFFQNDWHVMVSLETLKRTSKYDIECWRPYRSLDKSYSRKIKGITHRVFPSKKASFLGKQIFGESSPQMIQELQSQVNNNDVLLHLHHYSKICTKIGSIFSNNPIYSSQVGGMAYRSWLYFERRWLSKLVILARKYTQDKMIRNSDIYTVESEGELKSIYPINPNVERFPCDGIDVNYYFNDRDLSRQHLGIPKSKKMLLHVGPFVYGKGLIEVLDSFKTLREKYDVDLYLVGGHSTHPLYKKCIESGAKTIERIERDELRHYYAAADVYVYYAPSDFFIHSAGIGTATTEALASETPVVGNNLNNFLGDSKDIGIDCSSVDEMTKGIESIITNKKSFSNLREKVYENYDWDNVIDGMIKRYELLFEKYYSHNN